MSDGHITDQGHWVETIPDPPDQDQPIVQPIVTGVTLTPGAATAPKNDNILVRVFKKLIRK